MQNYSKFDKNFKFQRFTKKMFQKCSYQNICKAHAKYERDPT